MENKEFMEKKLYNRLSYVENIIAEQKNEITAIEEEVLASIRDQEILSKGINVEPEEKLTLGERLADKVAAFGGSWTFIIWFFTVLMTWIGINTFVLSRGPFDPYPFILLNLILSCVAALQAPVIMMSQNRQEAKDRARAIHDYKINLKAELEIRLLHEKVDYLLTKQWERLIEIQKLQMEVMDELLERKKNM